MEQIRLATKPDPQKQMQKIRLPPHILQFCNKRCYLIEYENSSSNRAQTTHA
jgi:hypothetical protein